MGTAAAVEAGPQHDHGCGAPGTRPRRAQGALWDLGIIPDSQIEAGLTVQPPQGVVGSNQALQTLRSQLDELGYAPGDITHVAFSHHHADHIANANDYAGALWLVQREGRLEMFNEEARRRPEFSRYRDLERSETLLLSGDHDVFGDG